MPIEDQKKENQRTKDRTSERWKREKKYDECSNAIFNSYSKILTTPFHSILNLLVL